VSSPRVVFERPRFSQWGVRVSMSVLIGATVWTALSSSELMARVMVGTIAILAAPFLLAIWYRVAQRVEIDGDGVTLVGRLGSRTYAWADVAKGRIRYPNNNWADVATPRELENVEPALTLTRTLIGNKPTPLQVAAYGRTRAYFDLPEALLHVRASDPEGDWPRQAAAIFAARDREGRGPTKRVVPAARVVPRE
jgi:hypothetical protein